MWKVRVVTIWHMILVCVILLCWKVWHETIKNVTWSNGRIMWTYVLDPAQSMKENRGCEKEMLYPRECGGGGRLLWLFLFTSSDFLLYARNRNCWFPAGWILPSHMKYHLEFKKNKTCWGWYNRVKRAGRNMGRSALRNKEGGKRSRWNW